MLSTEEYCLKENIIYKITFLEKRKETYDWSEL